MNPIIFVFKERRTSPGFLHRTKGDGNVVASIHLLRESDVDGHDGVELQKVEPTRLTPEERTRAKKWGPNGEWLGLHGILYILQDDYPGEDPHEVFRAYEAVRSAGPPPGGGEVTQAVPVSEGNDPGKTAPLPEQKPPGQEFDEADLDHDHTVTKKEQRFFDKTHPHHEE